MAYLNAQVLPPIQTLLNTGHSRPLSDHLSVQSLSSYKLDKEETFRNTPIPLSRSNTCSPEHSISRPELSRNRPSYQASSCLSQVSRPVTHQITTADLAAQVAQLPVGSWLDPENWLFRIVFDKVKHFSSEDLYRHFFYRSARIPWGINHGIANKKKSHKDSLCPDFDDWCIPEKNGAKKNHSVQEQLRRVRHNVFGREGDNAVSTLVNDLTNEMLPAVKEKIRIDHKDKIEGVDLDQIKSSRSVASNQASKQSGKDEQLLSAVFSHHYAAITVMSLHDRLKSSEEKLEQMKRERQSVMEENAYLKDQFRHSHDQEERHLDNVALIHNKTALPPLSISKPTKRTAEDSGMVDAIYNYRAKRQCLQPGNPYIRPVMPQHRELPPSPTPSWEE